MARDPGYDRGSNTFSYQNSYSDKTIGGSIHVGKAVAADWHEFAENAGWGDNPGGLWFMMLREYHRFFTHHVQ